jgi:AcrR family transcriptional regulator
MMAEEKNQAYPKQRIMDAAVRLFAKKGFSATGVRELASEADLNIAMINYYYGSKQKILEDIIDRFFRGHMAMIGDGLKTPGGIEDKIRAADRAVLKYFRENEELAIVALTEFPYDVPEIAGYKARYISELLRIGREHLIPLLAGRLNVPPRMEILGPIMISAVISHFIFKPVIEKATDIELTDQFYKELGEIISSFTLYGLIGKP